MGLWRRAAVEFLGTFWLVLGGCGTALMSAKVPFTGTGMLGIALAFGLTLVTGIYALGYYSGGHFNPAVTIGLASARRFPWTEVIPYWVAQVLGGIVAALALLLIARGSPGFNAAASGFAANGFGAHSPGHYDLLSAAFDEVVMTFMFVVVVLGATDKLAFKGFAPLAIGLALTLIHLISIPVTNTSVNPARSTGPAIVQGGWALGQLWLFWAAPLVGGILAGVAYPVLAGEKPHKEPSVAEAERAMGMRPSHPAHAR